MSDPIPVGGGVATAELLREAHTKNGSRSSWATVEGDVLESRTRGGAEPLARRALHSIGKCGHIVPAPDPRENMR